MSNEPYQRPSFTPGRRWRVGLNVIISAIALFAVVGMANYISSRKFQRFHLSSQQRQQLSPLTLNVLGALTNKLKVVVFYDKNQPLYGMTMDLLREFQGKSPLIEVEAVDYLKSPGRAEKVISEFKLASLEETDRILFSYNGRTKTVYARDLPEYDYNAIYRGEEVPLTAFKGEQLFTSAIFSLIDARPMKAYYVVGHHEHDLDKTETLHGYSEFRQIFVEDQIELVPVRLSESGVPADCQLLIVAGPQSPFLTPELLQIEEYLQKGGRLLALFRPFIAVQQTTGLEQLLEKWDLVVGNNVTKDEAKNLKSVDERLLVYNFGSHPAVNTLQRMQLLMVHPRSIDQKPSKDKAGEASRVVTLASTSEKGVANALVKGNSQRPVRTGSIPLIAAVEKGGIQGIASDRGATRIIATGDSLFLGNVSIGEGANRTFARNAINWLLNRDGMLGGIGPRTIKEYRITMSKAEMEVVRWILLAGLPGGTLCVGLLVWLRRRS